MFIHLILLLENYKEELKKKMFKNRIYILFKELLKLK